MKKIRYVLLAVIIILVLAFLTKPSEATCKTKTVQQLKSRLERRSGKKPDELMMSFIELAAKKGITISDEGLYQRIYFRVGAENKPIGWGAFGIVHTKDHY